MSEENKQQTEDAPPIFSSWNRLYIFVLICHAVLITAFYLFTQMYS